MRQLESSLTSSNDSERNARLRLQSIESELNIVIKDRDWHKTELEERENQYKSYRAEKHAQVVKLQTSLETAQREAETSTNALTSLRVSHASLETRLNDSLAKCQDASSRLADAEISFRDDIAAQKRLCTLLEERDAKATKRLDQVEQEWKEARDEIEERERTFVEELEKEKERGDTLEERLREARELNERRAMGMEADEEMQDQTFGPSDASPRPTSHLLSTPNVGMSLANGRPNNSAMALSPAAHLASRLQKSGRSYTEVYSDYVRIQNELAMEKAEVRRLGECLTAVLADIEDRVSFRNGIIAQLTICSGRHLLSANNAPNTKEQQKNVPNSPRNLLRSWKSVTQPSASLPAPISTLITTSARTPSCLNSCVIWAGKPAN